MASNSDNVQYKNIYFARLIDTSFEVIFDQNWGGFFKDNLLSEDLKKIPTYHSISEQQINNDTNSYNSPYFGKEAPYFAKRVVYGKFAYVAIESNYSYPEVRNDVEATFNNWKTSDKAIYDTATSEILSQSAVTVLFAGNPEIESLWGDTLDHVFSIFKTNYSTNFYGFPVYGEIRSVKEDKIFFYDK